MTFNSASGIHQPITAIATQDTLIEGSRVSFAGIGTAVVRELCEVA
jgi:hypothetical protein